MSADPDPKPLIDLPVRAVCCRIHGEPFRLAWPSGYLPFALTIAKRAIETSAILEGAAGGDGNRLNAAIAEFGPCCTLVTTEVRREAYKAAADGSTGWAKVGICSACRKWAKGALGVYAARGGALLEHHVCFDCTARMDCQT